MLLPTSSHEPGPSTSPPTADTRRHNEKIHLLEASPNEKNNKSTHGYSNVENGWSTSREHLTSNNKEVDKTDGAIKPKVSSLSRRGKLTLVLLCLANICAGCSYSILAPFYPNEAKKKGISETVTGFIFSSFQIVNFVSSLVFGNFMVQIGPKFLFVTGILTAGVSFIIFGLLDRSPPGTTFLVLSFVCRSFEAAGVSGFSTAGLAIVINEFPNHVATVFGVSETSIAIGLMIGPAIGGVLNEAGGFGLPFYVIGGLIFVIGFIIFIFLPSPQDLPRRHNPSMLLFLRSPLVWLALQLVLVLFCGLTFLQPVFSTYLEQFHLSPSMVGLLFVIVPVLEGLSTLWGYLADKKNINELQFIGGSLVCSLGFLAIGPTPLLSFLPVKIWVIIVGLVVLGLGVGFAFVAPVKCITQGAIELGFEYNLSVLGLVSGLFGATINIGSFIGPSLSGLLVQSMGFRWATTVMSGLFFLSLLISDLVLASWSQDITSRQRYFHKMREIITMSSDKDFSHHHENIPNVHSQVA